MFSLTAVLLAGCQTPEEPLSDADQANVEVEEVAENPSRYDGQTVTIRGEPVEQLSASTFTIEDDQFFDTGFVLVVNASGEPFVFPEEGVDVQVTGEVRNFVYDDIERDYRLGLDGNLYTEYENQPALIAQSITTAPEPGELTSNPELYYGEPLAVTGEVEDIQGNNTFTLDEERLFGGEDLLVLHVSPNATVESMVEDGEAVAVTGVLRPFVTAELERDYDFTWDANVQQELEAEFSSRPVLIADEIYPSAIPD